jgi:hypothetical protein
MSGYKASAYMSDVGTATSRASGAMFGIAVGWVVFPFAVQTAFFHPSNAIKLQLKLQGLPLPRVFTAQQLTAGFIEAVVALAVFALCQMVLTVLFYRWAQMEGKTLTTPPLWPLAASVGLVGNAAWWYGTGVFSTTGCIIGLLSAMLSIIAQVVCIKLGREFVMGKPGHAPPLLGPAYPQTEGPVSYYIPE